MFKRNWLTDADVARAWMRWESADYEPYVGGNVECLAPNACLPDVGNMEGRPWTNAIEADRDWWSYTTNEGEVIFVARTTACIDEVTQEAGSNSRVILVPRTFDKHVLRKTLSHCSKFPSQVTIERFADEVPLALYPRSGNKLRDMYARDKTNPIIVEFLALLEDAEDAVFDAKGPFDWKGLTSYCRAMLRQVGSQISSASDPNVCAQNFAARLLAMVAYFSYQHAVPPLPQLTVVQNLAQGAGSFQVGDVVLWFTKQREDVCATWATESSWTRQTTQSLFDGVQESLLVIGHADSVYTTLPTAPPPAFNVHWFCPGPTNLNGRLACNDNGRMCALCDLEPDGALLEGRALEMIESGEATALLIATCGVSGDYKRCWVTKGSRAAVETARTAGIPVYPIGGRHKTIGPNMESLLPSPRSPSEMVDELVLSDTDYRLDLLH